MRIVVDRDLCTGQAMCESVAPDLFQVADGQWPQLAQLPGVLLLRGHQQDHQRIV